MNILERTSRNEARGVGGLFFDYCKANEEQICRIGLTLLVK
jgi:coproporphyrinogen III oxidase